MTRLVFEIVGEPYAQKRHRSTKSGRTYNPPENREFKRTAQAAMHQALFLNKRQAPFVSRGRACKVDLYFYYLIPKSVKTIHKITKPDIDNLIKAILDAGNGLLWHDDNQVVAVHAAKRYTENTPPEAYTRVEVTAL